MVRWRERLAAAVFTASLLAPVTSAAQQELGNKALGTAGIGAGSPPPPGIYVADRVLYYTANELVGTTGNRLPVGLDIDAAAGVIGAGATWGFKHTGVSLGVSLSAPVARVVATTQAPQASLDRSGLGDLYAQPLRLGWRTKRFDALVGYAFYAPTGPYETGGNDGIGRGRWSHEVSLGSTVYFDAGRTWRLSALGSYELNERNMSIDVTRGNTIQIQGALDDTLFKTLDIGLAGYALWQVSDDSGSALPPALSGLHDRAFGLGPEMDLNIALLGRLLVRYEHDLVVRARPLGQIFIVGLSVAVWSP